MLKNIKLLNGYQLPRACLDLKYIKKMVTIHGHQSLMLSSLSFSFLVLFTQKSKLAFRLVVKFIKGTNNEILYNGIKKEQMIHRVEQSLVDYYYYFIIIILFELK